MNKGNPVSSVVKPSFWRSVGAAFVILSMLAATGCGGGAGSTTPVAPPGGGSNSQAAGTARVTSLSMSIAQGSTTNIKSDNSNTTTLTVQAIDSSNATVANATVNFTTDTGLLSAASVVTDNTGKATVVLSSGPNQADRTVTVTASCNGASKTSLVNVTGSTVSTALGSNSLVIGGATTTLVVTAKDASQSPIVGTTVTLSQSGAGSVTVMPATGTTDSNGTYTFTITPATSGAVTLTASAAGTTSTASVTVTGSSANAFAIDQVNGAPYTAGSQVALSLSTPLTVEANAPSGVSTVVFAATIGAFSNNQSSIAIPVSGGKATATYSSTVAGLATIEAYDQSNPAQNASIPVSITSPTAYKVTLQATPTVIGKYAGGNTHPQSSLVAYVTDQNNAPVGNAVVQFEILNPTGGGETITPVVVSTATTPGNGVQLGQAVATFYSGTLSSNQSNVTGTTIRAAVVGSSVATGTAPSGSDAQVVIGGTAGSVAISSGSTIQSDPTNTYYILPMVVLVADSNNNPVVGATVSLSAWPIAWNTGKACQVDSNSINQVSGAASGWFFNEDKNENLVLDPGEDGWRKFFPVPNSPTALDNTTIAGGTVDGRLTPQNSAGGTVPPTLTTTGDGTISFNLVYPKNSALHIWDRIRASTLVQGTETVGETTFMLRASITDDPTGGGTCLLSDSPWSF